jgi:hypothetical protein
MSKIEVGEMPCSDEDCKSHELKRPVTIFLNDETGGLTSTCDKCGLPLYVKVGMPVREAWIRRYCAANEAVIRAAEKRSGKANKAHADPAAPSAPVVAAAKALPAKHEPVKEEGGLWRR